MRYHYPYFQVDPSEVIDPKVKERIVTLSTKLHELGCSVVMLHDEWFVEAPEDKKEEALKLLQEHLETYVAEVLRQATSKPLGALSTEPITLQKAWEEGNKP